MFTVTLTPKIRISGRLFTGQCSQGDALSVLNSMYMYALVDPGGPYSATDF